MPIIILIFGGGSRKIELLVPSVWDAFYLEGIHRNLFANCDDAMNMDRFAMKVVK